MGIPKLGINSLWWNSWAQECPTANILKLCKAPMVPGTTNPQTLDADGNPTADFRLIVTEGNEKYWAGVFSLRFKGQATITGDSNATIANQSYNAGTNVTTADVTIGTNGGQVNITFTATKRLSTDDPGTGLTELALMLPGTVYGTDVFNPDYLAAISSFGIVRLMHPMLNGTASDNSTQSTWGQRTSPRGVACCRSQYGIPIEYALLLAREAGIDPWICISYYADADMHLKMAQAARYGTNGLLPYTGDYGSTYDPVTNPRPAEIDWSTWTPADIAHYPPLPAGRHIYIEVGNELWNGNYPQSIALRNDAVAEVAAGDTYHYQAVGGTNQNYQAMCRLGRLHKGMADTWASVFGLSAMMTTVRPMLCGQVAGDWAMHMALSYIAVVYGGHSKPSASYQPFNAEIVTTEDGTTNAYGNPAWPAKDRYVYQLCGAPYCNGADYAAQHSMLVTRTADMARQKTYGDRAGIQCGCYEGGTETDTGFLAAWLETQLEDLIHAVWSTLGSGAVYVHHPLGENAGTGLSPATSLRSTATYPRWKAISDIVAEQSAEQTQTATPTLTGATSPVAAGTDIDVTWIP